MHYCHYTAAAASQRCSCPCMTGSSICMSVHPSVRLSVCPSVRTYMCMHASFTLFTALLTNQNCFDGATYWEGSDYGSSADFCWLFPLYDFPPPIGQPTNRKVRYLKGTSSQPTSWTCTKQLMITLQNSSFLLETIPIGHEQEMFSSTTHDTKTIDAIYNI